MITLDDARPRSEPARYSYAGVNPQPWAPFAPPRVAPIADRFLHGVLWICIATSFFVSIQPAPYEFLIVLLAFACVIAGVRIDLKVLPLLFLMTVRDASGIPALFGVLDRKDSLQFFMISSYLGLTATIFACLFSHDTVRRIVTLRAAYIFAGVLGTLLGLIGYFKLLPGFDMFVLNDRVVSGFKDPNVYGPFLIPPLLWLMQGFVTDRIRPLGLIAAMIIAVGVLLAYSRAAWMSFILSALLLVWFLFVTRPQSRKRLMLMVGGGIVVCLALFAILMSIDVVREMLIARTGLQSYDTGTEGSRINTQAKALAAIVDYPLGMGPWEFLRINQLAAHNTILGITLNLGWLAGFAWVAHLILTGIIGLRCLFVRTPWQPFLAATYAAWIGVFPIGFVIDTDHWRHYYLLVGIVWGLSVATINWRRNNPLVESAAPLTRGDR